MDNHAGRTVADERDGYALIQTRSTNHPRVGDAAPDFELGRLQPPEDEAEARVRLSSFRGQRPVVLIFGSLT